MKNLIADLASRGDKARLLRQAVARPRRAWRYLVRTGSEKWMRHFFDTSTEYESLRHEIERSELVSFVRRRVAEKFSTISGLTRRGNFYIPGTMRYQEAFNIYALARKCRPRIVVETGVCNGFSTAVLLAALERNKMGHLYSIDYPEFAGERTYEEAFWEGKGGAVVPPDEEPGWLIPTEMRHRWTLLVGKTRNLLPPLLDRIGYIDFFVHDSEHSFENQLFEFRVAFEKLHPRGVLFASDISWSDAFDAFWSEVRPDAKRFFLDHNLAVVTKR